MQASQQTHFYWFHCSIYALCSVVRFVACETYSNAYILWYAGHVHKGWHRVYDKSYKLCGFVHRLQVAPHLYRVAHSTVKRVGQS